MTESLEESAAAYTKATAKKCILEKVEVRTGEEAESNVLQVNCHFRFDAENTVLVLRTSVQGMRKCNRFVSVSQRRSFFTFLKSTCYGFGPKKWKI